MGVIKVLGKYFFGFGSKKEYNAAIENARILSNSEEEYKQRKKDAGSEYLWGVVPNILITAAEIYLAVTVTNRSNHPLFMAFIPALEALRNYITAQEEKSPGKRQTKSRLEKYAETPSRDLRGSN